MRITTVPSSLCALGLLAASALAGQQIASTPALDKGKIVIPQQTESRLAAGTLTLGGVFSEHLSTGYFDALLPFAEVQNTTLFVSGRAVVNDDDQEIYSVGGGARYLFPNADVIVGGNLFYDSIESREGNHYNQLGIGAEILTRWVDARFNYYLPDDDRNVIGRRTTRDVTTDVGAEFEAGGFINRNITETERRRSFNRYEAALEGWNAEAGFLIPGLDRYAEVRVFGGYYHYENPFGSDFEGFRARLEARLLPGLIADLEYWDDEALTGGHWTAGARVSVPFDVGNLFTGRNPFEGTREMFTPRQREFRERLGEMVIRSTGIQTVNSGFISTGGSKSTRTTTVPLRPATPPPPPRSPVPIE